MNNALLTLDHISVRSEQKIILDHVSLTLNESEILTVIGPNGAGKSTLLKIALGLIAPSTGNVARRAGLRIGYMPQRLHIEPALPLTTLRFLQLGGAKATTIATALDEVDMRGAEATALQALSGGELQRVLLARALLRDPNLLVLDEPAQGVDLAGQTAMYDLIGTVRERHGCGVLMVSHDLHWVMAQTDHVLCLNQHICCEGHPQQVGSDPAYRALFGEVGVHALAPYQHHHNHQHDLHGCVQTEQRNA